MKVKELDRRVMLELIEHKYKELRANKIRIDENDFIGNSVNNMGYRYFEISEILLSIEKETNGKVKLLSTTPQNDGTKDYETSDEANEERMFFLKKKYPYYFYVNYDPYILEKRNSDKDIISITIKDGICRFIEGKKKCYMPEGPQRKKILFSLSKDFTRTEDLAKKSETTPRIFMSEIKDIRKLIEDTIYKNGKDVIENKKGAGYRINPSIKINY
jgi:hypothetical protein